MTKKELIQLMGDIYAEAYDRVWLHRKYPEDYENPKIRPIIQSTLDKYGLEFGDGDDFDYHYWEGIYAVMGFLLHKTSSDSEFKDLMDISTLRDYGSEFGLLDT